MRIAIPLETAAREQRVALIPDAVARLVKAGFAVAVQAGAGERAGHVDDAYRQAGASIEPDLAATVAGAAALLVVREPAADVLKALPSGCAVLGLIGRGGPSPLIDLALERRLTLFSLNALPRISRAQKMDALSSMAGVAGYKAVLIAANLSGKFFPLLMTAAGTVAPSRVLVLGAGVAGLQAIATARRLGAVVEAFDVRPAVKEEVQSLGASFLELPLGDAAVGTGGYAREMDEARNEQVRQWIASRLANTDVVISTASIPGRRSPLLVTRAGVEAMKPGSVIVDLAADGGGNCELTKPGETIVHRGVSIAGPLDVAATLPTHASQLLARNLSALLLHLAPKGEWQLDFADEITRGCCLAHDGRLPKDLAPAERTA